MKKSKTALLALAALILFFVAYFPAFRILVGTWWTSDDYSHAFLTIPIIAYMVWRKRALFSENQDRYPLVGLILMIIASLIYPLSLMIQMRTIIALCMCLSIVGAIVYISGAKTLKELATPLLLFALLIPVPDKLYIQVTFPLQLKVSQISEIIVRLFDVPILREGNIMNIPERSFEVVEACSGLRSMISLFTLSIIMGYFTLTKLPAKLVLVAVSLPTAIFVNIIRVVSMILFFHFYKVDLVEEPLHKVTGIAVFAIALITLFLIYKVLDRWEEISIKD